MRLVELAAGLAFVLATRPWHSHKHVMGLAAAVVSGVAWLAWILSREDRRLSTVALVVLSAAGGVSAAVHTTGGLFVFVATAATGFCWSLPAAIAVFGPGIVGFLITSLASGSSLSHSSALVVSGLLGIVLGTGRRQLLERDREATLLATADRRVALANREAQLTNERNRLGREIHDVVAHSLGAVSIQLTALETRIDRGDSPEALRGRVRSLRGLVADGLLELRDAVHALRDDELSLDTQINRLCTLHDAELTVTGRSRAVAASQALALYRVVQEALTNAAKHAAGAGITVELAYGPEDVTTVIDNEAGSSLPDALAETGGGHGLEGMRTRVELAGGQCAVGPHGRGWRVSATLPLEPHLVDQFSS
jgi:signal transduction histidine kinase